MKTALSFLSHRKGGEGEGERQIFGRNHEVFPLKKKRGEENMFRDGGPGKGLSSKKGGGGEG